MSVCFIYIYITIKQLTVGNWHYSSNLCQGLLFFILQCISFIPFDSQNVFEGKICQEILQQENKYMHYLKVAI